MSFVSRLVAIAATGVLGATALVAIPATSAQALSGADFDPGYIISDANFYDHNAMTEAQIQDFLLQRINSVGGCATSDCMAVYRTDTYTRPADRTVCAQYTGGAQESVARIIFKVQQACGISARVLLVTMQKEQSLLTTPAPSSWQMRATMGYACPDSGVCDAKYYGIYNQIYMAAWQLKRYSTPDPWGTYQPGLRYIQYNPNPDCGGSNVTIVNNATAALYNYTPYQPNAQSLANLYGSGGVCGAHGNRNFWTYWWGWFGNPIAPVIQGMPANTRLAGTDRFATAASISQRFATRGGVVFVANGLDFPDALSSVPAAAMLDAPVLLTAQDSVPASLAAELQRLAPSRIIIVGGEPSVSAGVAAQLAAYAPVERVGGADRFETSRLLTQFLPGQKATEAYIATGLGFADALAAGSAAAQKSAPVILVNGTAPTIDEATVQSLVSLGVTKVTIVGSEVVVSAGVAASIDAIPGVSVVRLGGRDRFETASLVVRSAFANSPTVYLASGLNFPDALAGGALAGATGAPLMLAASNCIHRRTAQDVKDLRATGVVILGGAPALGLGVEQNVACD